MEEYLIVHDYQHGGFAYRVIAGSREEVIQNIGSGFEVWADFRNDRCLIARFRMATGERTWDEIPLKSLSELKLTFRRANEATE